MLPASCLSQDFLRKAKEVSVSPHAQTNQWHPNTKSKFLLLIHNYTKSPQMPQAGHEWLWSHYLAFGVVVIRHELATKQITSPTLR